MKIDLSSFLDSGEAKKTKAGEELSEMVDYLAKFAEVVVRALKNGLDFENNINSEVSVVGLYHNTNQIIYRNAKKIVKGIIPIRALTRTDHIESFGWFIDDNGEVNVHARFLNAPSGPISCTLVILYV